MATNNPSSRPPKPAKIGRFKIGVNVLIQLAAGLLILAMLNYLSFNHYRRWDFTRTHRYSLSDKTKHVLGGLKKPVRIIVYFSPGNVLLPDVDNLLKEYQYASNGKITVETVDPVRNPTRAAELESTYRFGKGENIVILDYNSKERHKIIQDADLVDIDSSGPQLKLVDFKGEEVITGKLLEVTDDKPHKLYSITGQGERVITDDDYKIVLQHIEEEDIQVQPLNLENVDAVPEDAGVIFIQGARFDFSEREMKLLEDYWEKKGRMFILLDPNAPTPRLDAFLADQSVKPEDDRILRVNVTLGELVRYVYAYFIPDSPITQNLKGATGLFQGDTKSLTLDQTAAQSGDIRQQKLAQAIEGYWGTSNYDIHAGDAAPYFNPQKGDRGQPLVVVASIEKGALNDARVQVDSSRMIVSGNCDFISNKDLSLSNANLDFTINATDWLLDRTELIGIAPKANKTFSMHLTDNQMSAVLTVTAMTIPAIVAVFGVFLWWKRRH